MYEKKHLGKYWCKGKYLTCAKHIYNPQSPLIILYLVSRRLIRTLYYKFVSAWGRSNIKSIKPMWKIQIYLYFHRTPFYLCQLTEMVRCLKTLRIEVVNETWINISSARPVIISQWPNDNALLTRTKKVSVYKQYLTFLLKDICLILEHLVLC